MPADLEVPVSVVCVCVWFFLYFIDFSIIM